MMMEAETPGGGGYGMSKIAMSVSQGWRMQQRCVLWMETDMVMQ